MTDFVKKNVILTLVHVLVLLCEYPLPYVTAHSLIRYQFAYICWICFHSSFNDGAARYQQQMFGQW